MGNPAARPLRLWPTRWTRFGCALPGKRVSHWERLIPTIALDWTVAPRTTVYITTSSPIETAVHTDHLPAALKGPRAAAFADQATEVSTAPVLMKERIGRQESAF